MKIFIDADACPRDAKELTFRASRRLGIPVVLTADRPIGHPASPLISMVVVPRGMDSADRRIAADVRPGDLVITADIPLAAEVVGLGAAALDPRGEIHTEDNVRERLSLRDFLMSLRDAGENLSGPAPFSRKDRQKFADSLDKLIRRLHGN
ncbi:MAG: YaiI/YqxD family protein [Pseudomonadota bacterium]